MQFKISNMSKFPVSALIKSWIDFNGQELENDIIGYSGKEFWNLQFNEVKRGHFSILKIISENNLLDRTIIDDLEPSGGVHRNGILSGLNLKITMSIEVYCINEYGQSVFYPSKIYNIDYKKNFCIPVQTSKSPYWTYGKTPDWLSTHVHFNKLKKGR